jgi:hypothetical protein
MVIRRENTTKPDPSQAFPGRGITPEIRRSRCPQRIQRAPRPSESRDAWLPDRAVDRPGSYTHDAAAPTWRMPW